MKEWFTSNELIAINGMPNEIGSISAKARRENWKSRKANTGGRSLEYHISNFDHSVQNKLKNNYLNIISRIDRASLNLESEKDSKSSEFNVNSNSDQHKHPPLSNNFVTLDFYDVDVSVNHGALVIQEGQTDCIAFSRQFIDNVIGVNTKNVFLMPVKGDSMVPTLKKQAIIMVNKVTEFSGDGVYVFRFDSQIMVKRLQFTKTGLNVVSDNTTYKEWELTRDELSAENFQIIGEVVWSGQRI